MSLGAPSTTAAPLSTHAHGDPAPRPASCQSRECSSFRLRAAGEDGWRGARTHTHETRAFLQARRTGDAVQTHTHRRRRTSTTVPTPNQRWKTRVPSVNARTRSARTLVLRRRQYSALYPRTVNNAICWAVTIHSLYSGVRAVDGRPTHDRAVQANSPPRGPSQRTCAPVARPFRHTHLTPLFEPLLPHTTAQYGT